jgi:SAM-dependent methyltransferase
VTPASASPSEHFWEPRYSGADPGRGRRPNARLVAVLPLLAVRPGLAWDLGSGHGGDALWLASLGWHVTATDVSATAVRRVAVAAAELDLRDQVAAEQHDLSRTLPEGTFHLVYACYFHSPVLIDRDRILRDAAARVRPGGYFVLIDHGSAAPWSWRPDGREPQLPTPAQTLAGIDPGPGWETAMYEQADRAATGPHGQTATVTDNIIVLHRA